MKTLTTRRWLSALLLGAGTAATALADGLPACRVDPFALAAPPAEREMALGQRCGADQLLAWHVESPDPAGAARRNGVLRARIDNTLSEGLLPGLLGSVKLSWAGLGGEPASGLRTERSLLSAGGQLRVSEAWALQMNAGKDLVSQQVRTTAVGLWRPLSRATLFAELTAAENQPQEQRIGARWWLLPRRLAIDLDSRHDMLGWDMHRLGLTLSLRP